MVISLSRDTLVRVLFVGVFVLLAAHLAAYAVGAVTGHDYLLGLVPFVDFYQEANLPTWYSTMLLMTASVLLFAIFWSSPKTGNRYYWLILAGLFLFMSVDELAQLHELIGSYISLTRARYFLPDESSSAWIFWGGALSLAVGFGFFRF